MSSLAYTNTRPRGLIEWRPHAKTLDLLNQVVAVLNEYEKHLPLTLRQIFYRLVGAYDYPKDERAYNRLCEMLNRARRARYISFDVIRDDGVTEVWPPGFDGESGFWQWVLRAAKGYQTDRQFDQDQFIEIWVEAGGMVPQVVRVANQYGVPVISSGGFDSLSVKYQAARRVIKRDCPTLVLSVGDLDPSGVSMFDSNYEDVYALAHDMSQGDSYPVTFERVAVMRDQVDFYALPEKPVKPTDKRGNWRGGTVQAEALRPDDLAAEIERAIQSHMDLNVLEKIRDDEPDVRDKLIREVEAKLDEESL